MKTEDLLYKYFNRTITKDEYGELKLWIDASEENKQQFKTLMNANYLYSMTSDLTEDDSVYRFICREHKMRKLKRRLIRVSMSAAAVLLISFASYIMIEKLAVEKRVIMANNDSDKVVLTAFNTDKIESLLDTMTVYERVEINKKTESSKKMVDTVSDIKIVSVKVPAKLNHKVTLEDGTVVWINSDSELKYPNHFVGDTREVYLEGEAFFEVAENKTKPFIVRTAESKVKVLGTVFNINAYKSSRNNSTTLISGSVEMSAGGQSVVMRPNEKAVLNKSDGAMKVETYDGNRDIAWISGKYYFDAQPFEEILGVLSRWYDVKFTFTSDSIRNLTFTGVINKNIPINEIIEMLTEAINFQYVIVDSENIEIICN